MRVAVLFIDGVGVGANNPDVNPLARGEFLLSQFDSGDGSALPAGGLRHDVDTTFGIEGRPQSASNQAAILTGTAAPISVGAHVVGYPTAALKKILLNDSVAVRLRAAGRQVTFANGFPLSFLQAVKMPHRPSAEPLFDLPPAWARKVKPSAFMLGLGGVDAPLRTFGDVLAGTAITNDITGLAAARRFREVPQRTPEEAAMIFWQLAEDVTYFEHSQADDAGHARDWASAMKSLQNFDAFAREVLRLAPADAQVLICSDHGNVEDLSTRNHTRNKVSVLTFGAELNALGPMERLDSVGTRVLQLMEAA